VDKEPSLNVRTLRRPAGSGPSAARRFRANWPAELRGGGVRVPCTVIDISAGGASVRIARVPSGGAQLWLIIDKVAPIAATLAWREKERAGVRFLQEQQWVAESYRQRFDPSAWLRQDGKDPPP
jgi:hypothetical protein